MNAALVELRFGYTLHDLEQMTRAAIVSDRSGALGWDDRREVAWAAIAEALYAAPHWPARHELIRAGWQAIYREVRDGRHHHGYAGREAHAGLGSAPRFAKFWFNPPTSFEEHVAERIATHQVLEGIVGIYRDAVIALAVHGTPQAAAEAVGISVAAFNGRMLKARRDFARRWYDHETPPATSRRLANGGTTCGRGHSRVEHGRINNQGKWHCSACALIRQRAGRRRNGRRDTKVAA